MNTEEEMISAIEEALARFEALSQERRLTVAPLLLAALVAHECSPFQIDRDAGGVHGVYIDRASWDALATQIQAAIDAASVEEARS